MSGASEPVGTLDVALAHAARLLRESPALAIEQAREILSAVPAQPAALLLLGQAQGRCGQGEQALQTLREAVRRSPDSTDAWRTLGDHLSAIDAGDEARQAYAHALRCATRDPKLLRPAAALCEDRIAEAEALLRQLLRERPTDAAAIRMLAEVAARLGRYRDAELLLARCLELAPDFTAARHNYAMALYRQGKGGEALPQVEMLLAAEPGHPGYRNLKAAVLGRIGEYEQCIALYAGVLAEYPHQAKVWMSYGHALKTAGRQADCIAAYRRAIELAPHFGEAWWSLANLKTFRFGPADLDAMRAQLARSDLADEDRLHFDFALGKALEDVAGYEESFEHYRRANQLRRRAIVYSAAENHAHVQRCCELLTPEFFAARAGAGCPAGDPIFIVGLPRSGSTLLEQILASHPAVEGTMELPDIIGLARTLAGRHTGGPRSSYLQALAQLQPTDLRALGERYLRQTRVQRRRGTPFFIDKMPNNFAHIGLIHLILPNARIIDARRHPLGCCFSAFKQHFAHGQGFTYDLDELGRYYRDYVELMAHFDRVLPGRVHRVQYETLVADCERQVRALLAHCGLDFDERCLQFHDNERAVRTASSEQVRRPLYTDGVEQWRHYESWLTPLKQGLGPAMQNYNTQNHNEGAS